MSQRGEDATTALRPVCVIGAGTMGRGIAQVALSAGHAVCLVDPQRSQLDAARGDLVARLSRRDPEAAALVEAKLVLRTEITGAPSHPDTIVIEAVVERAEVKQQVFDAALEHFGHRCVLATNTSSLSITQIAASTKAPARVVGMHFFNPVPAMKLVEVVHGLQTDPQLIDLIVELATSWGKQVVRARSTPGFIVNRVARSFYGEALRLVEDRVAPIETVDAVMRGAGRFRMGPFELMDLIGVEVNFAVTRTVWESYHFDPRFAPSLLQGELVAAGRYGRKTGHGFYSYADAGPAAPGGGDRPDVRLDVPGGVESPLADKLVLHGDDAQLQALLERAGIVAEKSHADGFPRLELCGFGTVVVTRGLTAVQESDRLGGGVAVLDRSLDPASVDGLAVAGTDARVLAAAEALLTRAGITAYPVEDTPGLIVGRILAMIANEAWEAAGQGIATPEDIDTAMVLGTNYPVGPFAWTQQWGVGGVLAILDALSEEYRDPRYRASQHLRARARRDGARG